MKVLAITGSSGKTTTRKLLEDIFTTRYHTHATLGNLNNEIGLPLTLLKLSAAHEWAIVEMGMNHPGEISRLSRMALPDMAVITNTAPVHLEGLGSVENVALAKAEIFDGIRANSTAILFADDPRRGILEDKARGKTSINKILFFGAGEDAHIRAKNVRSLESHDEVPFSHPHRVGAGELPDAGADGPLRRQGDDHVYDGTAEVGGGGSRDNHERAEPYPARL